MVRKLLLNTGSNVTVMVIKLAITFIMTPVFVHNLGKYDYGLWEMIGSVIGYMGMLDLGVTPALSRFAAKYLAQNDKENLLHVYSTGLAFLGSIGIFLCVLFLCWGSFFPDTLAKESSEAYRYAAFLMIIGVQLLFRFPGLVAESFLEGFQKYYLKNTITIVNSVIGSSILYLLITPGNGLLLLALVNTVGLSLKYLIYGFLLSQKGNNRLTPKFQYINLKTLKVLMSFGFKTFIQGVSARVQNATDSLVIGIMLGPAMVPFYSIPANLVQYLRTFNSTLTHVFMPLFSGLHATSENDKIKKIYLLGSKFVTGLIMPAAIGIILLGGPFLRIWIGPEFAQKGDMIIVFLVIFIGMQALIPFGSRYLTAIGRHGIYARYSPVEALLNLSLSLLLIKPLGIEGVALASAIPAFIFFPVYLRHSCHHLGISVFQYFDKSIVPCAIPTSVMSITIGVIKFAWPLDAYWKIVGICLTGAIVYITIFFLFSLNKAEKRILINIIPIKTK
ncbi:MAG: oligosaccharide flippase family protein [Thermodesulfobacteriota bacterium]|nr:oligosaccharide flippase family protein [Thermodesulfobacteriota bacterium]